MGPILLVKPSSPLATSRTFGLSGLDLPEPHTRNDDPTLPFLPRPFAQPPTFVEPFLVGSQALPPNA
jgi:hypothetical protein